MVCFTSLMAFPSDLFVRILSFIVLLLHSLSYARVFTLSKSKSCLWFNMCSTIFESHANVLMFALCSFILVFFLRPVSPMYVFSQPLHGIEYTRFFSFLFSSFPFNIGKKMLLILICFLNAN